MIKRFVGIAAIGLGVSLVLWFYQPPKLIESPVQPTPGVLSSSLYQTYVLDTRGQIYGFGPREPSVISTTGRPVWNSVYLSQAHSWAIDLEGKLWKRPLLKNDLEHHSKQYQGYLERAFYTEIQTDLRFLKVMEANGVVAALDSNRTLRVWKEGSEGIHTISPQKQWKDFCISPFALYAVDTQGAFWRFEKKGTGIQQSFIAQSNTLPLTLVESKAPPVTHVYCSGGRGNNDSVMMTDREGFLWGYGGNYSDELGMGDGDPYTLDKKPVSIIQRLAPGQYSEVVLAPGFTLAIHRDGSLWAWGSNSRFKLGIGKAFSGSDLPHLVDRTHTWVAISAGVDFSVGLTSEGKLYTWGTNYEGSLGDDDRTPYRDTPQPLVTPQKWGNPSI